jgi:translation elongation factor EF-G
MLDILKCPKCSGKYDLIEFDKHDLSEFNKSFEDYVFETLQIKDCLTYYDTDEKLTKNQKNVSKNIVNFIKTRKLFETFIKDYFQDFMIKGIITKEMLTQINHFSMCDSLKMLYEHMCDYLDYDEEKIEKKIYKLGFDGDKFRLYNEERSVLERFLFYVFVMIPSDEFKNLQKDFSPSDSIGTYIYWDKNPYTEEKIKKYCDKYMCRLDFENSMAKILFKNNFIERFLNFLSRELKKYNPSEHIAITKYEMIHDYYKYLEYEFYGIADEEEEESEDEQEDEYGKIY